MTQDEIIEMARRAELNYLPISEIKTNREKLIAFAKLIAQHEREACANICEALELPEWPNKVRQPLAQAIRARGQA